MKFRYLIRQIHQLINQQITNMVVLFIFLGISPSFAAYHGPYLETYQISGFVPADRAYKLHCKVYGDHIELSRWTANSGEQLKTTPHNLKPNTIELIALASRGPIKKSVAPADIGTKVYRAFHELANGQVVEVDLGSIVDSSYISTNFSDEAETLKEEIKKLCLN